jgi:hypothetical protein
MTGDWPNAWPAKPAAGVPALLKRTASHCRCNGRSIAPLTHEYNGLPSEICKDRGRCLGGSSRPGRDVGGTTVSPRILDISISRPSDDQKGTEFAESSADGVSSHQHPRSKDQGPVSHTCNRAPAEFVYFLTRIRAKLPFVLYNLSRLHPQF